jgi:hypothetical protein
MKDTTMRIDPRPSTYRSGLVAALLLSSVAHVPAALAQEFVPGNLLVSRVIYDNNRQKVSLHEDQRL